MPSPHPIPLCQGGGKGLGEAIVLLAVMNIMTVIITLIVINESALLDLQCREGGKKKGRREREEETVQKLSRGPLSHCCFCSRPFALSLSLHPPQSMCLNLLPPTLSLPCSLYHSLFLSMSLLLICHLFVTLRQMNE